MCFVGERGAAVRVPQWVFERAHAVADVVDALRELGRAFAVRTAQFGEFRVFLKVLGGGVHARHRIDT